MVESNPPRGDDWLFICSDTNLSLEDVRQIVEQAGLVDLVPAPETLHF
jgi:hypothetical protein